MVLPLLVPQFVLGYSWTQAYGRAGFTDDLVGLHWSGLTGPAGIVVVLVVDAVPICYLLTTVGLATRAQPELELAARVSGASGWATLRTVTLPLLRPVLAAESVLDLRRDDGELRRAAGARRAVGLRDADHADVRRPDPRQRPGLVPSTR